MGLEEMEQAQITDACAGGTAAWLHHHSGSGVQGAARCSATTRIKPLTTVLANKILRFSLGLVPYLNL